MKNLTSLVVKSLVVLMVASFTMSSCRWIREKKAEKHQPFKPHKEGKMKRGKNNRR
jgi:hypothetical protein